MQRGDVVVVEFVHSDLRTSSMRPALVVQSDHNNRRIGNTIVTQIPSRLRLLHEPTRLLIDPDTPDGQSSGLRMKSVVTCENLLTLRQDCVHATIGHLSEATMTKIDDCLKAALGIP